MKLRVDHYMTLNPRLTINTRPLALNPKLVTPRPLMIVSALKFWVEGLTLPSPKPSVDLTTVPERALLFEKGL